MVALTLAGRLTTFSVTFVVLAALIVGVAPASAQGNAASTVTGIAANGSCEFGLRPPSNTLPAETSVSASVGFDVTLANGDTFLVNGPIVLDNKGCPAQFVDTPALTITYTGYHSTRQASQTDTLTLDVYSSYACPTDFIATRTLFDGDFYGGLLGSFGPGTQVSMKETVNGSSFGTVGPITPSANFVNQTLDDGGRLAITGGVINSHSTITIVFGAPLD